MLRLRTLGTIDLRGESGDELRAVLAQPKRVALLTYLALTSRRGWQRRDRVMALFWPELDAEHARNSLNQALFFLRRHLGTETILARNSEEILLALELLWCDAVAFEEMVAAGRHADAVELYHGELLAGFHVPEAAAELELWIDGERQRLRGNSPAPSKPWPPPVSKPATTAAPRSGGDVLPRTLHMTAALPSDCFAHSTRPAIDTARSSMPGFTLY